MMTMATKNEIFAEQKKRYHAGDKTGKGEILKHVPAATGITRKAAIRKFGVMRFLLEALTMAKHPAIICLKETIHTPDHMYLLQDLYGIGFEGLGRGVMARG